MTPTNYAKAESAERAVATARQNHGAMFLAGGTTVVDLLRENVFHPAALIDVSDLPLREVRIGHDTTEVGAMVLNSDLAWHRAFRLLFPVVSDALLAGASPQIRNMATVGGNLLQRTRCPYFRDPSMACNKRNPGEGCSAREGFNRSHAILGGSEACIATHPSDFTVALASLEPSVQILGPSGNREISFSQLYRLPENTPDHEFNLASDELITGIKLSHKFAGKPSAYVKVRDRQSYEFALASAAVIVDLDGGKIHGARVALGGVATAPWRAREAEDALQGQAPSRDLFARAAEAALREAQPLKYNHFKVELAKRTLIEALQTATKTA